MTLCLSTTIIKPEKDISINNAIKNTEIWNKAKIEERTDYLVKKALEIFKL